MIRTTEGEYGDLLITVVSATDPKAAKVCDIFICYYFDWLIDWLIVCLIHWFWYFIFNISLLLNTIRLFVIQWNHYLYKQESTYSLMKNQIVHVIVFDSQEMLVFKFFMNGSYLFFLISHLVLMRIHRVKGASMNNLIIIIIIILMFICFSYFFRNVYTGAVMTCSYKRNEVRFYFYFFI